MFHVHVHIAIHNIILLYIYSVFIPLEVLGE